MTSQYASEQPSGFKNRIENIAIVGAGGQVGKHITEHLLKNQPLQTITALTREGSTSTLPQGVKSIVVNYDDENALVSALQGKDALIITLYARAPKDLQDKFFVAAAKANVKWIMPNQYGGDGENEKLGEEMLYGPDLVKARKRIEELGVSSWVALACSFWYEYSLGAGPECYGFDFKEKKVIFVDDGTEKINTSTFPQCGRAVAAVFNLPVLPTDASDTRPTLSRFRNKHVFISSFQVNQRDMLDSVLRVTGDKESDWTIEHQEARKRWQSGIDDMQAGNFMGFARAMYTRVFFPTGEGNYEGQGKLNNELLGLPKENIDDFTKLAISKFERGGMAARD